jgi:hypothetical protein
MKLLKNIFIATVFLFGSFYSFLVFSKNLSDLNNKSILIAELKDKWTEKSYSDEKTMLVSTPYQYANLFCGQSIIIFEIDKNSVMKESFSFEKRYAVTERKKKCAELQDDDFFYIDSEASPASLLSFYISATSKNNFQANNKNLKFTDESYKNEITKCITNDMVKKKIIRGKSYLDEQSNEQYEIYLDGCLSETIGKIILISGDSQSKKIKYSVIFRSVID